MVYKQKEVHMISIQPQSARAWIPDGTGLSMPSQSGWHKRRNLVPSCPMKMFLPANLQDSSFRSLIFFKMFCRHTTRTQLARQLQQERTPLHAVGAPNAYSSVSRDWKESKCTLAYIVPREMDGRPQGLAWVLVIPCNSRGACERKSVQLYHPFGKGPG